MLNRVDEKGKVFTAHIRKMEVEVNIVTAQGEVHGYIHVQPGQRVKDLLNSPTEQFLAITRATIQTKPDAPKTSAKVGTAPPQVTHVEFLALNKQYVISVVPVDEDKIERRRDEEYYIPR